MSQVKKKIVTENEQGMRLDRWFFHYYPGLTKNLLNKLLRKGNIRVDGKRAKNDTRLEIGQEIRVPPLERQEKEPSQELVLSQEEQKQLRELVLYDDENLFIINKPSGLPVQGGTKHKRSLDRMIQTLLRSSDVRLVHRLDKDTSGVLVFAKNRKTAQNLTEQFRHRKTKKRYVAVVDGSLSKNKGMVDLPLLKKKDKVYVDHDQGQEAVTQYEIIAKNQKGKTFVKLEPQTGRTHQLRVHMAALDAPIVGDKRYSTNQETKADLLLHAYQLSFFLPDNNRSVTITAPLPNHFLERLAFFGFDPLQEIE